MLDREIKVKEDQDNTKVIRYGNLTETSYIWKLITLYLESFPNYKNPKFFISLAIQYIANDKLFIERDVSEGDKNISERKSMSPRVIGMYPRKDKDVTKKRWGCLQEGKEMYLRGDFSYFFNGKNFSDYDILSYVFM
uniref:Putative ovule protein n=1 Tax=Solanum chacoense TaxID=4108 RepID=A0A0V0I986_SOLCH